MSPSVRAYCSHILDEIAFVQQHAQHLDKAVFLRDETLKRTCVRSIDIIGEAIKQVPDPLRQRYPTIAWRAITGMRDRLFHHYVGVDDAIVWDVIITKLPALAQAIRQILAQETPCP